MQTVLPQSEGIAEQPVSPEDGLCSLQVGVSGQEDVRLAAACVCISVGREMCRDVSKSSQACGHPIAAVRRLTPLLDL